MRISIPQLANLGVSGYSFVGADIGGFNGSATPELLTRWMELGAFNPIYRNHSAKGTRFREPWVDGQEHEAIRKRYIETRYRLLPYIYTGIEESARTGVPLMRPMFLEFPNDADLAVKDTEFMFGRSLLVAPKVWNFMDKYSVSLPVGDWYDYWSGAKIAGGQSVQVDPQLDTLPVYVRAGSIIPQQPVVQNTDETPPCPLLLRVYPGPQCHGSLYADDGSTLAYQKGQSMNVSFTCEASAGRVNVEISAPTGPYQPWFQAMQIEIHGITGGIKSVTTDHRPLTSWKAVSGTVTLPPLEWAKAAQTVEVEMEQK